jgi:glucokinase
MGSVLGIDFGGTKILAGVVDTDTGEILSQAKKRTRSEHGHAAVLDRLGEVIAEAVDGAGKHGQHLQAAGVGIAGQVDATQNRLVRAPNLPAELLGDTVPTAVRQSAGVPATLYNDVVAAAAGEASFGAGTGHPDFVCIFVGTGIGGGIYRNGQRYEGATNTAGELGHMTIDYGGRLCGCGGLGHLEAYASRSAVVRSILAQMHLGRESSLRALAPDPDPAQAGNVPIRSKALKEAVEAGDALTIEMLDDAARYLGAGLASIVNFYNPPLIILGGGLVDAVDRFFQRAAAAVRQQALQVPRQEVQIVKAALGDFSGIVGAAVLAGRDRRFEKVVPGAPLWAKETET